MTSVTIVGGGLAGCEAAWQLAERGHDVVLHEMRPVREHRRAQDRSLAELVCSQHVQEHRDSNAHGLLKAEMRALGSLILWAADEARVPGGSALAVDRDVFAGAVHERGSSRIRASRSRAKRSTTIPVAGDHRHRAAHLRCARRPRFARGSASTRSRSTMRSRRSSRTTRSITTIVFRRRATARRRWRREREEGAYLNCPMIARAVRGVHRRAHRRPTSITATSSTRCRTSRAACPSRRWPRAGARRFASGR